MFYGCLLKPFCPDSLKFLTKTHFKFFIRFLNFRKRYSVLWLFFKTVLLGKPEIFNEIFILNFTINFRYAVFLLCNILDWMLKPQHKKTTFFKVVFLNVNYSHQLHNHNHSRNYIYRNSYSGIGNCIDSHIYNYNQT